MLRKAFGVFVNVYHQANWIRNKKEMVKQAKATIPFIDDVEDEKKKAKSIFDIWFGKTIKEDLFISLNHCLIGYSRRNITLSDCFLGIQHALAESYHIEISIDELYAIYNGYVEKNEKGFVLKRHKKVLKFFTNEIYNSIQQRMIDDVHFMSVLKQRFVYSYPDISLRDLVSLAV